MLRPWIRIAFVIPLILCALPPDDKAAPLPVPAWLYPAMGQRSADDPPEWPDDNPFVVKDWSPASHPALPDVVAHGRKPKVLACAYCHLPDGSGRPENASVAGLPAAYMTQQIHDLISGARRPADSPMLGTSQTMIQIAQNATPDELAAAIAYFSSLPMPAKLRVVEAERIPKPQVWEFLYALNTSGPTEALGQRIIEAPEDRAAHSQHRMSAKYVAYVPVGSIEQGRQLASGTQPGHPFACAVCHGPDLRGGPLAPPIAGRSPSGLLRQLLAIRNGTRAGQGAALMQPVVGGATLDELIALSAFVGSQAP
ncbi:MAG TPA: hypothetical protein VGL42_04990 [Opitutaceae bacterium]|jgi:cytochrome c553